MIIVFLVYTGFVGGSSSQLAPFLFFLLAFLIYLGLADGLDLLNLKSPMRIEILSRTPLQFRIYTRSLREPIIENSDILRFSRRENELLVYFLPVRRKDSLWFRPLFPWTSRERHQRIRQHQFASVEEWHAFTSVLQDYPQKQEADVLAGRAA